MASNTSSSSVNLDPKSLIDLVLASKYFTTEDGSLPAMQGHAVHGEGKLLVIVGTNASGKSFFRRITQSLCRKEKVECIHLSMEGRKNNGHNPLISFVYGNEAEESTGVNSVYTITKGIQTSQERDNVHVIVWDEPDIGLSEGYAAGLGRVIARYAKTPPDLLQTAIVITHSRYLIRELLELNPSFIHLGEADTKYPESLREWVDQPVEVLDPLTLRDKSRARWKAIEKEIRQ